MRSLILFLVLNTAGISFATEFGGHAQLNFSTNQLNEILLPQWKSGDLRWIRANSPWLAQKGFNQSGILISAPPETRREGGINLPDDLLALYWHCRTNRPVYPQVRHAWEIWNEPDFHFVAENPDRMAAVLKAAYWGIKAGNPDATVLMPSLAFNPGKYTDALARNNIFPYTEGYNFHYYGWAHDFLPSIAQHRRFLSDQGINLPLWITEAGYFQMRIDQAQEPLELARQQAFHERVAISAYAAQIDYYLPFILTPYTEGSFDLGLTASNLAPRPALDSYLWLTHQLPDTKPLYQIWHRPTQSEIGIVLQEKSGQWWTALWSPYRWRDVPIRRTEEGGRHGNSEDGGQRAEDKDQRLLEGRTDLELEFRFPRKIAAIQLGLKGELELEGLSEISLPVSADQNLHIRTKPIRFQIEDCEWRKWPAPITERKKEVKTKKPSPVVLQLNMVGTRSRASHLSEFQVKNFDSTDAGDRVPTDSHSRDARERVPTAHKPSQTYRGAPGEIINARLDLYNFSEQSQSGEITWSISEFPFEEKDSSQLQHPTSRLERLAKNSRGRGQIFGTGRDAVLRVPLFPNQSDLDQPIISLFGNSGTRGSASLPGLDKISLPIRIKIPEKERAALTISWTGEDGTTDHALIMIEPEPEIRPPNSMFPALWENSGNPNQWKIESVSPESVRFTLDEPIEPGRMGSVLLPIPSDVRLEADDVLRLDLRLATDGPRTIPSYYRINLLTSDQLGRDAAPARPIIRFLRERFPIGDARERRPYPLEVFRYTEDLALTDDWQELAWRIGDFGPTFWSRVNPDDYSLPVRHLRFLRVSISRIQVGDIIEIRNVGINK